MKHYQHIILDRDGVLNREGEGGFITQVSDFEWLPHVLEALHLFHLAGIKVSVVTNQSCVGRGLTSIEEVDKIHCLMSHQVKSAGGVLEDFYACFHLPDTGCSCRKPQPGLLLQAIEDSEIPAAQTLFVGDSVTDKEAADAAGIDFFLIRTGKGLQTYRELLRKDIHVSMFYNLEELAHILPQVSDWRTNCLELQCLLEQMSSRLEEFVLQASYHCRNTILAYKKILVCGNGGSAADAQHFTAELTGRFEKERRPLAALALTTDTSALTAIGNDYGYEGVFSRQVMALGNYGDILIAISTSGNSPNIIAAIDAAKSRKVKCIALTGQQGGKCAELADVWIGVPSDHTARIQEAHCLILHTLAGMIENDWI